MARPRLSAPTPCVSEFRIRAESAESRDDWDRAKMWWWYAATSLIGNPAGLRTYFHQREDAAKARCSG